MEVAVEAALVSSVVAVLACAAADDAPKIATAGKSTVANAEIINLVEVLLT